MAERVRLTLETQSTETKDPNTSRGPRSISAKQIDANRRNALHSTGPTTPEGKEASRCNALKHGLRAKEMIIPGQEDPAEFEAILTELYEEWEAEGHTERHLVQQIGRAEWRLSRAIRAELGEIRTQMPSSTPNFNDAEKQIEEAAKLSPHTLQKILAESTLGILCLRKAVENALDELESEGTVSEETCLHLGRLFGDQRDSPATILNTLFFEEMPEGEEDDLDTDREPTADKAGPDEKAAARKHLEMVLKDLDRRARNVHKHERTNLEIARQRLSIPQSLALERILRYETAIKREMRRDIDQLERLQRRRRGEPLPPTVNVNVSKDE